MDIISTIVAVWSTVMSGIVALFEPAQALFWSTEGITFLGSLSLVGVAVGVVLLVIGIIQRFLKLGA